MTNNEYYIIIPSFILKDKSLSFIDKITYGHIKKYADLRQCFASNQYLADEIGIEKRTLIMSLKLLKEKNYIRSERLYSDNNQIIKRILHIETNVELPIDSNNSDKKVIHTLGDQNTPTLGDQNTPTLGDQNTPISNKSLIFREDKEIKNKESYTQDNVIAKNLSSASTKVQPKIFANGLAHDMNVNVIESNNLEIEDIKCLEKKRENLLTKGDYFGARKLDSIISTKELHCKRHS